MGTFILRRYLIAALLSLLLFAGAFWPQQRALTANAQVGGGCVMLGDPIVTSETEYCIEVQAMIGCNCVWRWGIPECDELHFCLYDSCQYPNGTFSFSVFCTG